MTIRMMIVAGACVCLATVEAYAQQTGLSSADKEFMIMAAKTNMTEAHLGQMAQSEGAATDVKNFGQTLTQDHTKAYEELTELSGKTGESVPKGINVGKDATIQQLAKLKGPAFDRVFLRHEIQDHEKAATAFRREAERGRNPEVKGYAQKLLPTIEEHLREAQKLAKTAGKA